MRTRKNSSLAAQAKVESGMQASDPKANPKRDAIIQAAVTVFAESGYYNSRVSDIVKKINAAQGLFYYYFESKEEMLLTIYQTAWNNLLEFIDRAGREHDGPLSKIRAVIEYIFKSFRKNPDLMKVLIMDVPRLERFYDEENQQTWNLLFNRLAEFVKEGQEKNLINPEVSPLVAAYIIHASVDGIIRHNLYNPKFDTEAVPIETAVDQVVRVLFNGLVDVRIK
ncbi:MAG: TetR/AcrR family transcriptional regulator [Pseudomonadota bacterium]